MKTLKLCLLIAVLAAALAIPACQSEQAADASRKANRALPDDGSDQPVPAAEYEMLDSIGAHLYRVPPPSTFNRLAAEYDARQAEGTIISPSQDDFDAIKDNPFRRVADEPLSTFSIDVDTASYAMVRRMLNNGQLPPRDAVRVEEFINYFDYDYAPPTGDAPFSADFAVAPAPWKPEHKLVRIALKGREVYREDQPAFNLVFLVDVSGSMNSPDKLGLVKRSLTMLSEQLDEDDRIAIVVYAGSSGVVLPATSGDNTQMIADALSNLSAGGGTAGGAGIQLAYKIARENFDPDAVNRVLLCTDGDFNVGVSQAGELEELIAKEAESGVFLSVLGFGMGNLKDRNLETLSNRGNGNYAYIDTFAEARKFLVDDLSATLVTIAKDVKIQVEFNPANVAGYRLIGYENRMLAKEDFNDDTVDAGEIGAGHRVTALYEVIPAGLPVGDAPPVDELRYQSKDSSDADVAATNTGELLLVKLRYKEPDGDTSTKLEFPLAVGDELASVVDDPDFAFATAVAAFGQRLRDNEHIGDYHHEDILALAEPASGDDRFGYRAEFVGLVKAAMLLAAEDVEE